MPPKKKSMGPVGKALIRDRFGNKKRLDDGSVRDRHTTDMDDGASWTRMQSITQENDLEAFLNTAQLAGTEFTAERFNIKVVNPNHTNPFLLTPEKEKETLEKQKEHKERLTIPRRPEWTSTTTPEELDRNEREFFLNWRRDLAMLEEEQGLLLTPYERNLEVWRQLWRVIERSDLIVQIVDGRNPLFFRNVDLEKYVVETSRRQSSPKNNLLMINKADMLTVKQRLKWADYLDSQGVKYVFFSAALAKKSQEEEAKKKIEDEMMRMRLEEVEKFRALEESVDSEDDSESEVEEEDEEEEVEQVDADMPPPLAQSKSTDEESSSTKPPATTTTTTAKPEIPDRVKILSVEELLDLFYSSCPEEKNSDGKKPTVGLLGYPNVGKSSTINALVNSHVVSVSSTPGKTKHFQTIHLNTLILCDCPGLVFPSFATTKAEMVVNGVLPIDQLREWTGPCQVIATRFPKLVLETMYGIKIKTRDEEGKDVNREARGEEICQAYAVSRGYRKGSQGHPDEARAARYLLKDYVNGKILYCVPPPTVSDGKLFNRDIFKALIKRYTKRYQLLQQQFQQQQLLLQQQQQQLQGSSTSTDQTPVITGGKSTVDTEFFSTKTHTAHIAGKFASDGFSRVKLYPHQGSDVVENVLKTKGDKQGHKKGKRVKRRDKWVEEN